MRFIILFLVQAALFLPPAALRAQNPDAVEWPMVIIVLTAGDTITKAATYFRGDDVLSLEHGDGTTTTLTPVLVSSFVVTDKETNTSRHFRTYPWNHGRDYSDYLTPAFFEQLNTGKYMLLKREVMRNDIVRNDPFLNPYGGGFYGPGAGFPRWVTYTQELFYLRTPKGNIITLRNPKRDFKRLFASKHKLIKEYVRDNDLNYNRRNDLVKIVEYFNSLTDPNYKSALTYPVSKQ
ncbi:MAG: hypothetical protein EOP49_26145 [Sphingobacteriales bacterium]|nr:MAG: hypothetical protein EOP49_26145 [Sphingobacteriales bacterium]